jgi:hypothetical protein
MSNKFTYQVLRDTNTDAVIKITGAFDGSGQEANGSRIQANSLYGALDANGVPLHSSLSVSNTALSYYDLQVTGVKYYVNFPTTNVGGVEIYWNGAGSTTSAQYANSATIFHLNLQGEFGLGEQLPAILNNSGNTAISNSVGNGDLGVMTTGGTANSAYTIIVALRKNNAMYQRGQFNDPAAFNYRPYGLTPGNGNGLG